MANLGNSSNLWRGLTLSALLLAACGAANAAAPARPAPAPKAAAPAATSPAATAAQPAASAQPGPIVLYTTSWCGFCRKTRALLTELGETFEDKDIEKNEAARKEYQAKGKGYTGIPLIDFDGTMIRGYNENMLRSLVAERKRKAAAKSETAK